MGGADDGGRGHGHDQAGAGARGDEAANEQPEGISADRPHAEGGAGGDNGEPAADEGPEPDSAEHDAAQDRGGDRGDGPGCGDESGRQGRESFAQLESLGGQQFGSRQGKHGKPRAEDAGGEYLVLKHHEHQEGFGEESLPAGKQPAAADEGCGGAADDPQVDGGVGGLFDYHDQAHHGRHGPKR